MTTPLLKYPGGKRKVAAKLLEAYAPKGDYAVVDLCTGGGSYLHAAYDAGCRNLHAADASPFTHQWWMLSRKGRNPCAFIDELQERSPFTEEQYYILRDTPLDRLGLADLYILNRLGFNGLVRYNKSGGYNVPWGKRTQIPIPSLEAVANHLAVAGCIQSFSSHYQDLLFGSDVPGPTVYVLDPPYLGGFTAYGPGGWGARQLDVAVHIVKVNLKPGDVAIIHEHTGGEAQALIEEAGATLVSTWDRAGTINANPNDRGPRQEGVWLLRGDPC